MKSTNSVLHLLPLLLLLALLQGCGFHLRGSGPTDVPLPSHISPLAITGLERLDFMRMELESQLVNSGIEVAQDSAQAVSLLRIISRMSDRRVETVDSRGKVLEYRLRETVKFRLDDRAGNTLVPEQSFDLIRIYAYEERVLGSRQEETFLRKDMWRSMADQILTRIARQLR